MARTSSLRASDADRERVADRLRQAAAEGRILAHELEDRVHAALRARTYGDLDAVVADLPRDKQPTKQRSRLGSAAVRYPLVAAIAVASVAVILTAVAAIAFILSGAWVVFLIMALVLRGGGRRHYYRYRYGRRGHVHIHEHFR
jgi:Flp pilus assembly protein TadB